MHFVRLIDNAFSLCKKIASCIMHVVLCKWQNTNPLASYGVRLNILSKFPRNYVFLNHGEERFPRPSPPLRGETKLYSDLLAKTHVFPWVWGNYWGWGLLRGPLHPLVIVFVIVFFLCEEYRSDFKVVIYNAAFGLFLCTCWISCWNSECCVNYFLEHLRLSWIYLILNIEYISCHFILYL